MKFDSDQLNKHYEILKLTPSVLENLLSRLGTEWLLSNEGGLSWNPAEILCHLIHCEEDDWVKRAKIILSENESKNFEPHNRTKGFAERKKIKIGDLLNEFKQLRNENLKYLLSLNLTEKDLEKTGMHPDFGEVTLKELLSAWVVHDLSHISQICRVMSKQLSDEVGPWQEYLPILKK